LYGHRGQRDVGVRRLLVPVRRLARSWHYFISEFCVYMYGSSFIWIKISRLK
jgi:hypothetical protein